VTAGPDSTRANQQPVIDRLLASRERVIAETPASLAACRRLAETADEAIREFAESAEAPGRWAVVALGGYGSGRLLPSSDLDLLVLSDAPATRVKPFAEAVFYPLWDSGLPVGHQVRSRKDHLRAAAEDLSTLTASLTGRVVAGDADFGLELLADVATRAGRNRRKLLKQLAARRRSGSPYLLQPDLKEGAGGQRDLDELAWTAAVLSGRPARDPSLLVGLGLLAPDELAAMAAAAETLAAARWTLHLTEPRAREAISLETAETLPFPADALNAALADVAHVLDRVRRRVAGTADPALPADPATLFAALDAGERSLPLLEEAAWAGSLERMLPGMRSLTTTRRPGLSHTLTVGAHSLAAAALVAETPSRDPLAARALAALPDRRPLLAAALTHDFGKTAAGPGHAERGEDAARAAAVALGIGEAADDVACLVGEHLLLGETVARADLSDEDTLLRVAARVGRRDLVGPLFVLTVADTLATDAAAWSPWRAALTHRLAARLDDALSPEVAGAGIAAAAARAREGALALLAEGQTRQRAFVTLAPMRYLAATVPETVALHAELAAPLVGTTDTSEAALAVTSGPLPSTWRVTVATLDRPGLFASLAGVFSLAGLSILDADALPGPGGTAIDVFVVASATLAVVDTATWASLERILRGVLGGHTDLEVRLAERGRHYPARERVPARVTWDASGALATAVRVEAADRVGLLHDLARTLAVAGLDIRSATALTHDGVASDTFLVVDRSGDAPRDPEFLASLADRVRKIAE
jgi:[protein-PII] uridylyltransferase